MDRTFVLVCVAVVLYCTGDMAEAACDEGIVDGCIDPIKVRDVFKLNDPELDKLCGDTLTAAKKCIDNTKCAVTDEPMKRKWTPHLNIVTTLCDTTVRKGYKANRDCLISVKTSEAITGCKPEQFAPAKGETPPKDQECSVSNKMLKCQYNAIEKECGDTAADVVGKIYQKITQATFGGSTTKCDIEDPSDAAIASSHVSILLLASALIGVMLAV